MGEQIIRKLQDYLEKDPGDIFTRFALALEYIKTGKKEEALHQFEDILQSDPEYIGTYYHLGKLYSCNGEKAKAVNTYQKGIEVAISSNEHHALVELRSALLELEYDQG